MNEELQRRFPEMTLISSAPSLFLLNGCGTRMAASRDYDRETGTYVLTQAICLLFIPIFWLKSFRVADAQSGGWYFLGRVPTSKRARYGNVAVLIALLVGAASITVVAEYRSPNAVAGRKIEAADGLAAGGRAKAAAEGYRDVIRGGHRADDAQRKFSALFDSLPNDSSEATGLFEVAADFHRKGQPIRGDLSVIGKAYVKAKLATDPAAAATMLDAIAPFAADPHADDGLRGEVYERWVAAAPGNLAAAEKLAGYRESHGDLVGCEALLAPHEKALGTREGAAILGRVLAAKGEYDRANAQLAPYVTANLGKYLEAEQVLAARSKAVQNMVGDELKNGTAKDFDFTRAKAMDDASRHRMADDYLQARIEADGDIKASIAGLRAHGGAVSAALELGMVQLHRGRAMADPKAREAELKNAEKTFLSIRNSAGQTEEYKIKLGQVYYWLGRPAEGRKLFDELLAAPAATFQTKLAVVHVLREVGVRGDARKVCEALYAKETDPVARQAVAHIRALMPEDTDDEIAWLQKADGASPSIKASLQNSRARKAELEGRRDEAIAGYRAAAAVYDAMPEGATALNNGALALIGEYGITGDSAVFARAADKLDRALALEPSDSILLTNAATTLFNALPRQIVGDAVDARAIDRNPTGDMLPYLYADEAGLAAQTARIVRHPAFNKTRAYAEKLTVVAPKSQVGYALLVWALMTAEDVGGMRSLAARADEVEFDDGREAKDIAFAKGVVETRRRPNKRWPWRNRRRRGTR